MADFNEAQEKVLQAAVERLGEHFDRVVVIVDTTNESATGESDATQISWHGGFISAIGLLEYGKERLMGIAAKRRDTRDE